MMTVARSVPRIACALLRDAAGYIPPEKYPLIHQAALAARDGVQDGLIYDPTGCRRPAADMGTAGGSIHLSL